jgi:hypothetical protein
MTIRKTLSFRTALEDNFSMMIRIARRRAKHSDPALLASERNQYCTTLQECECGETCHLSALYRVACPCSQYSLGAAKPHVPERYLDLHNPVEELKLVDHSLEHPEVAAPSKPDKWQAQAVKKVKRFPYSRKTEEIEQYMREHFTIGLDFTMGRPVSLF